MSASTQAIAFRNASDNITPVSTTRPLPVCSGQVTTAPSNSAPITSAADITLAAGDKLFIQNLDTDALFVRRATGATSSLFNYVLQGGGAADDGTGGALVVDDFVGVVSFAGTTVRYNAWKA
jgi:hypothetical protein